MFTKTPEETFEMLKGLKERASIVDFETIDGGFRLWPLAERGSGPQINPSGHIDMTNAEVNAFIVGIETIEYRMTSMFKDNPDVADIIMERSMKRILGKKF